MLLSLAQWLQTLSPEFGFFRVFQYLTFRAVFAALTALLIGLAAGPLVIRRLRKQNWPAHPRLWHGNPPEQERHTHHGRCADPAVHRRFHPVVGRPVQPLCLDRVAGELGFWRDRLGRRLAQGGAQGPRGYALAREVFLAVGDWAAGRAVPGVQHLRELQYARAGVVLQLGALYWSSRRC